MTESHIRIKFTASLTALQDLEPYSYKVLMYLASRSDSVGVCFPAPKTIAEHISISLNCVYDKLQELVTYGYIKFLRKAYYDDLTKKSSPAVFQVSPHFLEIAEKFHLQALGLWSTGIPIHVKHESNQQQELPSEQTALNQPQETTTTTNSDSDSETANRKPQKQQREQTNSAPQQKANVPPIVKNYTNPILITQPLPDLNEQLAESLSTIQIKIIMARGFIAQYGYDLCNMAYKHLQHIQQNQTIDNPAGFYRYLLQSNMANVLPTITKKPHIADDIDLDTFYDS